ncbi:MAG: molecular chaperone DnaJ, partial [Planctomycetes bacterium]|nr:molecular chaperone DnaJ [Planctomycetota bacterium]
MFDAFFEGLGVKKRRTYHRGSDIELVQEITLEEAFSGTRTKLQFKTFVACVKCAGQGHFPKEGFKNCATCDGHGEIRESRNTIFGSFSQVRACSQCAGVGKIPNKVCVTCRGEGRISGKKEIFVDIAPGISNGQ